MAVGSTTRAARKIIIQTPPDASPIRARRAVQPMPIQVVTGTFRSGPTPLLGSVGGGVVMVLLG